jgi:endonuclease/exonuclease/phosphatase (EEP) superfamily protein YafD
VPGIGKGPVLAKPLMRTALMAASVCCVGVAAIGWIGPPAIAALASPWMVQVWVTLLVVVALLAVVRARVATVGLLVPLALMSWWVIPVLRSTEVPQPMRTMRIVFANVNAWNPPSDAAVEWIHASGADVVALIECSPEWVEALRSASLDSAPTWPLAVSRIEGQPIAGVALLSRFPLRESRAVTSPVGRFPLADAIIDAPSGPVRILVAHPVPPLGPQAVATRDSEIEWLADLVSGSSVPAVVVADFNDTPFGRALRGFAARSGMRSAASVSGLVTTWPVSVRGVPVPAFARIAIDHCFVSDELGVAGFATGPDIGSDHLPLIIDIVQPGHMAGVGSGAKAVMPQGPTTGQVASFAQSPKLK